MKKEDYGFATLGYGTETPRKVPIESCLQASFKDGRNISLVELKDGEGYAVSVNNPENSGRSEQKMLLTKDSLVGVMATAILFFSAKGINLEDAMKEASEGDKITYSMTDNLKKAFENER